MSREHNDETSLFTICFVSIQLQVARTNKNEYGLILKLKTAFRANKEMKFLALCKQFLKRCHGSKQLLVGRTVNKPYLLCKISIRSGEKCSAYRSNFFGSLFYKALSICSAYISHMLMKGKM